MIYIFIMKFKILLNKHFSYKQSMFLSKIYEYPLSE